MHACRNRSDALMLDILGELSDPGARQDWEAHLDVCEGCRQERVQMLRLISRVRWAGMPPGLPEQRLDAMADHVGWRLRNERIPRKEKGGRRLRLVPAMAAVSALIVIGLLGYRVQDHFFNGDQDAELTAGLQLPQQDFEVIKHLDLLKDLDTIEKLVHVVDTGTNGQAPSEDNPETQGTQSNETKDVHV